MRETVRAYAEIYGDLGLFTALEISLSVTPARGFESHPVRQLQGFCYEQKPCFFMSSLKKFPHGHPARLTAPDNALSDDTFDVASRCEYVFAVVEKSLCPSHT